jgi:hypothetical protein
MNIVLFFEDHKNGITRDDRGVAVNLSRYSAYLIAYIPELCPYHKVDIKDSLEVVEDKIGEVKESLKELVEDEIVREGPWSYKELKIVDGTDEEDNCWGSLPPAVNLYRSCVGLGWLAQETTGFRLVRASEE